MVTYTATSIVKKINSFTKCFNKRIQIFNLNICYCFETLNIIFEIFDIANLDIGVRAKCWRHRKSRGIAFNATVKLQIITRVICSSYCLHIKIFKH